MNVGKNALTSVDLGGCPALESANISENAITELAMSNLEKLTYLGCWNNQLAALNLGECPNLERLLAYNNKITAIDLSPVKKVSYVKIQNNPFESINLNGCEALEYFLVAESTDNYGEGNIRYVRNNKGAIIGARRFFLTGTNLTSLSLDLNNVVDVDPANFLEGAATTITGLEVFANKKLAVLDVANFTQMTYLDAKNNALTAIDVKANTELTTLLVNGNKIESVDVAGLDKLAVLNVSDMATLTSLNIEGATSTLAELYLTSSNSLKWNSTGKGQMTVQGSALRTLALNTKNTTITTLTVTGNATMNSLNIDNSPQVTILQVQNNVSLTSLNVATLVDLDQLMANNNDLTAIDLSNNAKLGTLKIQGNRIAAIDLSAVANLSDLDISSNYISVLDLSANEKLKKLNCSSNFNLTNIYLAASLEGKITPTKDEKAVVTYGQPE